MNPWSNQHFFANTLKRKCFSYKSKKNRKENLYKKKCEMLKIKKEKEKK